MERVTQELVGQCLKWIPGVPSEKLLALALMWELFKATENKWHNPKRSLIGIPGKICTENVRNIGKTTEEVTLEINQWNNTTPPPYLSWRKVCEKYPDLRHSQREL